MLWILFTLDSPLPLAWVSKSLHCALSLLLTLVALSSAALRVNAVVWPAHKLSSERLLSRPHTWREILTCVFLAAPGLSPGPHFLSPCQGVWATEVSQTRLCLLYQLPDSFALKRKVNRLKNEYLWVIYLPRELGGREILRIRISFRSPSRGGVKAKIPLNYTWENVVLCLLCALWFLPPQRREHCLFGREHIHMLLFLNMIGLTWIYCSSLYNQTWWNEWTVAHQLTRKGRERNMYQRLELKGLSWRWLWSEEKYLNNAAKIFKNDFRYLITLQRY